MPLENGSASTDAKRPVAEAPEEGGSSSSAGECTMMTPPKKAAKLLTAGSQPVRPPARADKS
eukprot:7457872-Lingulodinium_polyedra.AAC.1